MLHFCGAVIDQFLPGVLIFFVEKEIQVCSKTEKVFVTPFDFYWFP